MPQASLEYPCVSRFPLTSNYSIRTGHLLSCTWSFLTAHQLTTRGFWSLSLSLLSCVYQVYGSVCLLFCLLLIHPIPLLVPLGLLILIALDGL